MWNYLLRVAPGLLLDVTSSNCVGMKTHTQKHTPHVPTSVIHLYLNIEKGLAVSPRSCVPWTTSVLKKGKGVRRRVKGVCPAANSLQRVVSRLRRDDPECSCVAVPAPSEMWSGTFSPGITVFPGTFVWAPLTLLWYSLCAAGYPDWKDGIPEPG